MKFKSIYKKISVILLAIFIIVNVIPLQVFADDTDSGSEIVDTVVDLVNGKGDPKVLEAQKWLNETYSGKFTYNKVSEDGQTGSTTVKALIIALQIELGMENNSNGTFGPTTTSLCPTISKDNQGSNKNIVKILQHGLFCKGYGAYDDYGTFGNETNKAIKELQSDAGLDSTGIVTPLIFKAVLNTDPYVMSKTLGDPNIRFIQQSLNKYFNKYLGLIPCNGIYERATNKALICALGDLSGVPTNLINGNFGDNTTKYCPSLIVGDSRKELVVLLQFVLYCNGYLKKDSLVEGFSLDVDRFNGVYDSFVKSNVTEFQEFMCLDVSGNADKRTMMSLFTSCGDPDRSAKACDTATRINETTVKTIKSSGFNYIGRYLTNAKSGTLDKKMTPDEIKILSSSGISIFPIYQTYGGEVSYYTVKQGETDAISAQKAALDFGIPYNSVIYFAVDYDAYDYQVTEAILPYFEKIYETMQSLGVNYKIGIYAPRNVCSRICDAGYAEFSFVSDASKGYSGNLGYCMPKKWAFDQFKTDITIGSGSGSIAIDKVAYSGRDSAVSKIEDDISSIEESYFMLEYLRHTQSALVLSDTNIDLNSEKFKLQQNALYVMYSMLSNNLVQNDPYVCEYISARLLNNETFSYSDIKNIKSSLMQGNKLANKYFAIWEQESEDERNSMALNIVPFIGGIKGFIEGVDGKDILTGRNLAWWEKALGITCGVGEVSALLKIFKVYTKSVKAATLLSDFKRISYSFSDASSQLRSILDDGITKFKVSGYTTDEFRSITGVVDITNPTKYKTAWAGIWKYNPTIVDYRGLDASQLVKSSDEWVAYYRYFLSDEYIDEIPGSFFVGKDKSMIKKQMALLRERIENTKKLAIKEGKTNDYHNPSFMAGWEIENCGEIWAARDIIFDGSQLDDIMFKSKYLKNNADNPFCDNCKITFEGLYELVN